ncbi:non-ribosomal peptide synthetase, partial [[Flexibacter] sp. ATCC 35103]|uniref:non-ribosomal peptide synthetase n=1 Tax=[Flexibacter] sp. ATCC 35103 TaxID=1937528 RepID=UPI0009C873C7
MNVNNDMNGFEFSENQKNLWSLKDSNEYYNQIKIEFKNPVKAEKLLEVIENIITSNEILNYRTISKDGFKYPIQSDAVKGKTEWFEIEEDKNNDEINLDKFASYDPAINNPIRFFFIKESTNVKFLYVRVYSLWSDSFSLILFSKLLFSSINLNKSEVENSDIIEYSGFSSWQNELISEPEPEAVLFWKKYKFDLERKNIPFQNDSDTTLFKPQRASICKIECDDYAKITSFCNDAKISKEHFLLNQYLKYLFLFEETEVTIGYVPFERKYKELANTLGFVNTITPLLFEKSSYLEVAEALNYIQKQFDSVLDWADFFTLDRENNSNISYFKYQFEFIDLKEENEADNSFLIHDIFLVQDKFDLKVSCIDYGNYLTIDLYFNEEVFAQAEQNILKFQVGKYFKNRADNEIENFGISEIEHSIISHSNNTKDPFAAVDSILELFNDQVVSFPGKTAILNENIKINYNDLNSKSDQFKNYLIEKFNIGKGDAVCFIGNATEWYIISVLGILKSGAYYIPIDANYPINRINYILEESKCKVIICDPNLAIDLSTVNGKIITPSYDEILGYKDSKHEVKYDKTDIAYCIFTSGSTGKPKGCMISHSNLSNYIQWANKYYFEDTDFGNWGLFTSISFDLSITALFTSLTRGKQLWISNFDKEISSLLKESLLNPEIDTLKITPAHISLLKDLDIKNSQIKRIICGGEKLFNYQIDILKSINEDLRIFNEYGPTEATVGCIATEVFKDTKIVIGKPIANMQVYILDESLELCHIGQAGEIFLTGLSLSKGYLNNALTDEKFIVNPFNASEKIYRTGDIGYWLADGNIEYLERKDQQVKIRGYRIELGEIESQILQFSTDINQVVVDVKEKNQDKILVAYLVSSSNIDKNKLRAFLNENLPYYMVPVFYVALENLPLTPNGKIDRKSLPNVGLEDAVKNQYVAAINEIQHKIVEIWQELLGIEPIGIRDNFFGLGGHSLIAVQIFNRIFKELGKSISLKLFFENPTIESLSLQLQEDQYTAIGAAGFMESYPMSASQERFWLLSQLEGGSLAYNMPAAVVFTGKIDADKLEESFRHLIARHEILRTNFKTDQSGENRQYIRS